MAKLSDLDLSPDPLDDPAPHPAPNQREVDAFLQLIEDHLTRDYEWARETLEGIHTTVEETNRVTLKQREAVERIILGRLKHESGR